MNLLDLYSKDACPVCGQTPCNCTHLNEEKVRLDPSCWHNKKIGNPKTKIKGGVRVNNCVPKESVANGSDDLRAKLDLYNEKAFEAGHRHDDQAWRKYTKAAKQIADQLGLKYKVTGYGLEILEQGVAEGLNEFAPDGFNSGGDGSGKSGKGPKARAKAQMIKAYGPGIITFRKTSNGGYFIQHEDDFGDTNSHQYDPQTGKVDFSGVTRSSYYGEGVAEGSEDNRPWTNKEEEKLRRSVAGLDSMFGKDDAWTKTKQKQIKQQIKTKPMAGPKGQLPEQGVAEAAKWRRDDLEGKTWRSADWDDGDLSPGKIGIDRSGKDADNDGDELNTRPGMWRGKSDMAKRMTKKGVPTKSELGFQDNLKMRMRMKQKQGGLTGPKGVLPEQDVAEDLDSNQKRVGQLGPTEKVKNNNIGKLVGANESVEQGVAEGYDDYEFHTSVEKGKFLPSKFGNKRFVYLHDLENQSPSTGGPQLVTVDDAGSAKQLADQFGGKVVKTKLGTFRIVKPAEQGVAETMKKAVPSKERDPGALATRSHISSQEQKHKDWAARQKQLQDEFYANHPELDDRNRVKENMADEFAKMAQKRFPNALIRKNGETVQQAPEYKPAPQDPAKLAQAWAQRYPNIDADIAAAKKDLDPNYEYAEGPAYYRGKAAQDRLTQLLAIKKIIDAGQPKEQSGLGFGENKEQEADYGDKYQSMVQRVGQRAREQEKTRPVDIQDLARRLRAIDQSKDDK